MTEKKSAQIIRLVHKAEPAKPDMANVKKALAEARKTIADHAKIGEPTTRIAILLCRDTPDGCRRNYIITGGVTSLETLGMLTEAAFDWQYRDVTSEED